MRFTIRDLLWLTVVVALGLGWWVDRQYLISQLRPWGVSPPAPEAIDRIVEAEVDKRTDQLKRAGYWKSPNPSAPAPNLPSD
jgi:hypothetical protein